MRMWLFALSSLVILTSATMVPPVHAEDTITRKGNTFHRVITTPRNNARNAGSMAGQISKNLNNDGQEAYEAVKPVRNRSWETPWMAQKKKAAKRAYSRNDGADDDSSPAHRTLMRRPYGNFSAPAPADYN